MSSNPPATLNLRGSDPDKAWTHWLLDSIKNGVAVGYDDPYGASKAHNLKSALKHTQVFDEDLRKEHLAWPIFSKVNQKPRILWIGGSYQ